MSGERLQAVVLRRTNYGEADRILQLLTPKGKVSAIARGVRREKSKLAGGIELFAVCDVVVRQGKGDLGTLTSARLVQFFRHILEDYDTMQFGYEVIKQVTKASEMVDEPDWYDVTVETFEALDDLQVPRQLIQTWFYLRVAQLLGHELSLTNDVDGHKLHAEKQYAYDVGERGFRLSENGEIGVDHIKLLRLLSAKPLKVVAQVGGIGSILPDCLLIARQQAAV